MGILIAITTSSFLVWGEYENDQMLSNTKEGLTKHKNIILVVSNFQDQLVRADEIHNVIFDGLEIKFQNLLEEDITSEQYIEIAEASSTLLLSEIIELHLSNAPKEWHRSYLNYRWSLESTYSLILETIVVANLINENADQNKIDESLTKISLLREKSKSFAKLSYELRL